MPREMGFRQIPNQYPKYQLREALEPGPDFESRVKIQSTEEGSFLGTSSKIHLLPICAKFILRDGASVLYTHSATQVPELHHVHTHYRAV